MFSKFKTKKIFFFGIVILVGVIFFQNYDKSFAQGGSYQQMQASTGNPTTASTPSNASSQQRDSDRTCVTTWNGIPSGINVENCFAQLLYYILYIFSFLLGIVGYFFNLIFELTVLNMSFIVDKIDIIKAGWQAIRDVTNILFIFMLLYLAIATILQLDEHGVKHSLSRLIIGGVLINFSLFFVKVPIDISNIIAIQIYNQINPVASGKEAITGGGGRIGLGDSIMSMFNPQLVFKDPNLQINPNQPPNPNWKMQQNPLTTFAMGLIIIWVAIFVFLAVIIIFIKRFITLVMLMVFSPLAFAGMAIPNHDIEHQITHKFWNSLIKEAFYAPVFMFMIYLTIKTGQALNNTEVITKSILDWGVYLPVTNIISYSVVVGMMIFSLTVSETIGVEGASGAVGAFNSMRSSASSWVTTNTISRAASTFINAKGTNSVMGNWGDKLRDASAGKFGNNIVTKTLSTYTARAVTSVADQIGKPFDEKAEKSRAWMEEAISNRHGDHKFKAQLYAQAAQGGGMSEDRKAADNQFHHMSIEEKANMKLELEEMHKNEEKIVMDHGKPKPLMINGKIQIDSNGKTIFEKKKEYSKEQQAGAKRALDRYFNDNGHGRLEADEVNELPRKMAQGLTHFDNKFKEAVQIGISTGDTQSVQNFIQNATEGQMLSAVKALGGEAEAFSGKALIQKLTIDVKNDSAEVQAEKAKKNLEIDKQNKEIEAENKRTEPNRNALRNVYMNGVSKFKGESYHSNIAKDQVLDTGLKEMDGEAAFRAQMRHGAYKILTSEDPGIKAVLADPSKKHLNQDLKSRFEEAVKNLPNMAQSHQTYIDIKNDTGKSDAEKDDAFKNLLKEYGENNPGEETTFNYMSKDNAKRAISKSKEVKLEIEKQEKILRDIGIEQNGDKFEIPKSKGATPTPGTPPPTTP